MVTIITLTIPLEGIVRSVHTRIHYGGVGETEVSGTGGAYLGGTDEVADCVRVREIFIA